MVVIHPRCIYVVSPLMGPLSTYTYTHTSTPPPPVTSCDSHPCQQSFSVSVFPAATEMEKATLLRGLICLPVCFSLFAFIFIFYDCPLLLTKLPKETGMGWGWGWEACKNKTEEGSFEGERGELKMASVVKEAR